MRPARLVTSLLGTLIALLLVAVGAASLYVRSAHPVGQGSVALPGLGAEVEVWRDTLGVPHVWAGSTHDLLFAQGYLHAQDRLWQMELFRRVAEGRLAEVMGSSLVSTDRFLRTIGLWRAAAAQEAALAPESRKQLEAYAAGVNAWLRTRRGALPPELLVLRIEPEPWTVRHSLAIEKIMAWDLALYGGALALTRIASRLDSTTLRFFQDAYPSWGPTIVESMPEIPMAAAALLDAASITRASNAWVIGGSRTRSGKPILANDMHLALNAPSLWYLMALHGGEFDVAGVTLPGAPYVVAGHSRAIAWGFTNAMVDDVDFFVERVDPSDSTRYITPAGSEPFTVITETIRVKGQNDPVVTQVRLTRHGPILPDAGGDQAPIAMRWVAHDVSNTFDGLAALNLARSWEEFLAAVRQFDNPHQNVVYADTAGNFGYVMGGRMPRRGEELPPPILPVPGWTGEWDWNGYLPFERHPRVLNPRQGYVVTANNQQVAGDAATLISSDWEPPYRAQRIRDMILAGRELDADAVHAMQLDQHDALAARYRAHAVAAAHAAGLDRAAATLESWDLLATAGSHAAALFYAWCDALRSQLKGSLFPDGGGWMPRKVLTLVLDSARLPWVEGGGRAAFDAMTVLAAHAADSVASGKTWGDLHRVVAVHALAQAPALDRVLKLNVGDVRAGGSPSTVNVSHYSGGDYPVRAAYGPSQRHVVDMADVDGAGGFILPTGQSGLPFDAHYRDQWPQWLNGGLWRIPLDRAAAAGLAVRRLTLRPAEPSGYDSQ